MRFAVIPVRGWDLAGAVRVQSVPIVGAVDVSVVTWAETVTDVEGEPMGEEKVGVELMGFVAGISWEGVVLGETGVVGTDGVPGLLVRGGVVLGEDGPGEVDVLLGTPEVEASGFCVPDVVPVFPGPLPPPVAVSVSVDLLDPVERETASPEDCRSEDDGDPVVVDRLIGDEESGAGALRVESREWSGLTGPAASVRAGEVGDRELTATAPTAISPTIPPAAATKGRRWYAGRRARWQPI
jgi:hypothetical protein